MTNSIYFYKKNNFLIWHLVMKTSIKPSPKLCHVCDNLKSCLCMPAFKIHRVNKRKCTSVEYSISINICIRLIKIDAIFTLILPNTPFASSVWATRSLSSVSSSADMIVYYGYALCACLLVRCVLKSPHLLTHNTFYWNWRGLSQLNIEWNNIRSIFYHKHKT